MFVLLINSILLKMHKMGNSQFHSQQNGMNLYPVLNLTGERIFRVHIDDEIMIF